MVGQTGQKVTKYGQPYQSKSKQRIHNGEEGKLGKSERPKKKWTTVDTTIHSKLQRPPRWDTPDVPTSPRVGSASQTIQRNANSLSRNPDIVIKEADKGSDIVVMNTKDYLAECHRQLGDTTYYKPLTKDPTTKFARKVTAAGREACSVGVIDDDMESALTPNQPRPDRFHILPKIHKNFQSFPPGRPIIISGSGTATEKISLYVDLHLKPHVKTLPSYLEDDNDFLRKLILIKNQHGPLPEDTILCTMDVTALYTNIPTDEFISASQHYLARQHTAAEVDTLSKFMELILTQNNFELAGQHFIQIRGTAMGTWMAPSGACLFMGRLEEEFLATAPKSPLIWLR